MARSHRGFPPHRRAESAGERTARAPRRRARRWPRPSSGQPSGGAGRQSPATWRAATRLVVSELSRLGRSLGQIVTILDALAKAGVAFVALKENIRVEGKHDIRTKVMTTLFALFAEVERALISERTREGLARARASGRKLGRPKGSLASHGSTARRTRSAASSSWASRRPPSPSSPACPGPPSTAS